MNCSVIRGTHCVATRPISMCATQWFTATSGFFHIRLSMRAATAHERKGPPIPGNNEKRPFRLVCHFVSAKRTRSFGVAHTVNIFRCHICFGHCLRCTNMNKGLVCTDQTNQSNQCVDMLLMMPSSFSVVHTQLVCKWQHINTATRPWQKSLSSWSNVRFSWVWQYFVFTIAVFDDSHPDFVCTSLNSNCNNNILVNNGGQVSNIHDFYFSCVCAWEGEERTIIF